MVTKMYYQVKVYVESIMNFPFENDLYILCKICQINNL